MIRKNNVILSKNASIKCKKKLTNILNRFPIKYKKMKQLCRFIPTNAQNQKKND